MPTNFLRRGQAQHLFNDLLPGIIFVILGVILLSYATSSHDREIRRDVDDRFFDAYAQRQLLQFLQTRVLHLGEHKEIWQILYEAQDHQDWTKSAYQLHKDYGMLWGDALLVESTAPMIFDQVFDDWYLFLEYEQLDYKVQLHYKERSLRERCLHRQGHDYYIDVKIPGEQGMNIRLNYCVVPEVPHE